MRLIVGISGASGVIMGYQMLKALKQLPDMEVHLIITEGAVKNFECETNIEISRLAELADFTHSNKNLAASISSGSFCYGWYDNYSRQYENRCRDSLRVCRKSAAACG